MCTSLSRGEPRPARLCIHAPLVKVEFTTPEVLDLLQRHGLIDEPTVRDARMPRGWPSPARLVYKAGHASDTGWLAGRPAGE